jgi:hypothetical protein
MTTIELDPSPAAPSQSPADTVFGIALGYLASRALHVATELGIADHLAAGPQDAETLAEATGVDPGSLYRVLRTLAGFGIFVETDRRTFDLTPAASLLRSGVFRDGVLLCGEVMGDGAWWSAVGHLRHSVTTGTPSFEHVHGIGAFAYLGGDPECRAWFDRGMANFSAAENPEIAASCVLAGARTIVDVGGGQGGFLAELLRATPTATGVLVDVAEVVANPVALDTPELSGRWRAETGDFFEAVTSGGDVYVLKRILHDWDDEDCVRILRACRAAMTPASRLLIVDAAIPPGNGFHPAKVMDILMMVFSGRERTEAEFAALLADAGLTLRQVTPTPTMLSVIEARLP